MYGYTGKILHLKLSERKYEIIETAAYDQWVGGHGIGSAIFFDLVRDKTIDGFDEKNVVTVMTSPLTGTIAPGAGARLELQGIGVQSYPYEWFTRSNIGGRFGPMLKFAGWDGIVIGGKADSPVWVDIRDEGVTFRDGASLWGLDTWQAQEQIWQDVGGKGGFGRWIELGDKKTGGRTTQRPAVLAIGQAGENLSRMACIVHDAGNAAAQGGFGAVWGSKNLKAISVIGSGTVTVADARSLLDARLWAKKNYQIDLTNPNNLTDAVSTTGRLKTRISATFSAPPVPVIFWQQPEKSRPKACFGCPSGCRAINSMGLGNESSCIESWMYSCYDLWRHSTPLVRLKASFFRLLAGDLAELFTYLERGGKQTEAALAATDLTQRYGLNAFELLRGIPYLRNLNKMGVLGKGRQIDTDLQFQKIGTTEFAEELLRSIAYREGIGDDVAEGFPRAAEKWGRVDEDSASGLLPFPYWGYPDHYDPRVQLEWGYGSMVGDRDINEHVINTICQMATISMGMRTEPAVSAQQAAEICAEKMEPFDGDPMMIDFSTENMYSEHIAKMVSWHRHYTRFWKQSVLFCDFLFPDFINPIRDDKRGLSGEAEPKFYKAVTGRELSFAEGVVLGKKIWNLDNAIWSLQGRHRDMVHFAEYIYTQPYPTAAMVPGKQDGEWAFINAQGRSIDKDKFEEWKTLYYTLEGWDIATGWPTRKTLSELGLDAVADELEEHGKLGA
ncbi:MAG: aldehyde:ferredoxin oxidoreductase [Deltaproteobacteria bacterium]|nr:aldehyde:ferredoxin oxidoreductase [Deltaproteobacteria bacterium]